MLAEEKFMDMSKPPVSSFLCSSFATSAYYYMHNKWRAWGECSWPALFQFSWLFLVFWVEIVTELWSLSMYVPLCLLLWLVSEICSKHACLSLCLVYCQSVIMLLCIWCFSSSYFPGNFALKVHSTPFVLTSTCYTFFLQFTNFGFKYQKVDQRSKFFLKKSWIFYAKKSLYVFMLWALSSWKENTLMIPILNLILNYYAYDLP